MCTNEQQIFFFLFFFFLGLMKLQLTLMCTPALQTGTVHSYAPWRVKVGAQVQKDIVNMPYVQVIEYKWCSYSICLKSITLKKFNGCCFSQSLVLNVWSESASISHIYSDIYVKMNYCATMSYCGRNTGCEVVEDTDNQNTLTDIEV